MKTKLGIEDGRGVSREWATLETGEEGVHEGRGSAREGTRVGGAGRWEWFNLDWSYCSLRGAGTVAVVRMYVIR